MTFDYTNRQPKGSVQDLVTAAVTKDAGITVYLIEELGDARVRCEQVKRFVAQAMRLVSKSTKKDHFYEVAGDILQGLPDALFKLDKALAATALAASRLDYEELKVQLKPEKVQELEDVLRDVRIRQIDRRAPYLQPQVPAKVAKGLEIRDLKNIQSALEAILMEATTMKKSIPPGLLKSLEDIKGQATKALSNLKVASTEQQGVEATENQQQGKTASMFKAASQSHIAGALRRLAAGIESATISPTNASIALHRVKMALAQTAQQALEAMGPIQATSREDVIKGFKGANPALTKEQLEEIADHWEENKDVVKDKHKSASERKSAAGEPPTGLFKSFHALTKKFEEEVVGPEASKTSKAFMGEVIDLIDSLDSVSDLPSVDHLKEKLEDLKANLSKFTRLQSQLELDFDGVVEVISLVEKKTPSLKSAGRASRAASRTFTAGLTDDDTLSGLLEIEVEILDGDRDAKRRANVTPAIEKAARAYESDVEAVLQEWVESNLDKFALGKGPLSHADTAEEVVDVMSTTHGGSGYLYFMEAEGHGVGTWDGDWDDLVKDKKTLKELSKVVKSKTHSLYSKLKDALEAEASKAVEADEE